MSQKQQQLADTEAAQKALDLLQEIVWAIRSRPADELIAGVKHLRKVARDQTILPSAKSSRDMRRNAKALVGAMPLLLSDTDLFPSNEDIAKFATEALAIEIPRWGKRSRYEMIGMLVMETIELGDSELRAVARFVSSLGGGGKALDSFKKKSRQTGFSWNEAIRSLSSSVD